jgi:hypothetical protein
MARDRTLPEPPELPRWMTRRGFLWVPWVMPGILAGVYIGLGGLFATVALARVG